jgi:hypothetical protein
MISETKSNAVPTGIGFTFAQRCCSGYSMEKARRKPAYRKGNGGKPGRPPPSCFFWETLEISG